MKLNIKNKYTRYLEQAQLLEKDRKFETAKILYKKCIEINPNDDFCKKKLKYLEGISDYSCCICNEPGFCPRYAIYMDKDFINHSWCQTTTQKERELFLSKRNKAFFTSYFSEHSYCLFANIFQKNKKHRIDKILNRINDNNMKFNNVRILCLGHSEEQFNTIKDKDYLVKVNLNEIDAGKYSRNDWSESRAFISKKKLFEDSDEFIGFITASWNNKYQNNPIDLFHKWDNARILLNSKPEDKIFLCADTYCTCLWLQKNNVFTTIYKNNTQTITKSLLKLVGLKANYHRYVPYSHQMIAHKENIQEYIDFLNNNDIFAKVDWFVKHLGNDNFTLNFLKHRYNNCRLNGYFMELISCFWFAEKDYIYLENTKKTQDWYSEEKIKERSKRWQ